VQTRISSDLPFQPTFHVGSSHRLGHSSSHGRILTDSGGRRCARPLRITYHPANDARSSTFYAVKRLVILKSFDPPDEVFQVIHMDFWGPVGTSKEGNKYVLVLTDNLSKYVIAKAMPTNTARDAADFIMNEFIMVHGTPQRLISDNGVHFNSAMMKNISATMKFVHAFSAVYHPQTNGQVERFNSTFSTQLAKYNDDERDDWNDYLSAIVYAYNTSVHSTTGFTPYELAFGRKHKSVFDPTSPTIKLPKSGEFYTRLRKIRRILLNKAQDNIRYQQRLSKQRYDNHRKDTSYSRDDLVYVKAHGNRTKLDQRWIGPCCVIDKQGDQNYLVKDQESGKTMWIHTTHLQPVVTRHI
jgi:transposase InsO family protein